MSQGKDLLERMPLEYRAQIEAEVAVLWEMKRSLERRVAELETLLQTEGTHRVKAEKVIALIAHSNAGDYDWGRSVCLEYLNA